MGKEERVLVKAQDETRDRRLAKGKEECVREGRNRGKGVGSSLYIPPQPLAAPGELSAHMTCLYLFRLRMAESSAIRAHLSPITTLGKVAESSGGCGVSRKPRGAATSTTNCCWTHHENLIQHGTNLSASLSCITLATQTWIVSMVLKVHPSCNRYPEFGVRPELAKSPLQLLPFSSFRPFHRLELRLCWERAARPSPRMEPGRMIE